MNEVIAWLNSNSGAIQAISTIILVIITWWYVSLTKKLSESAQESIKITQEQNDVDFILRINQEFNEFVKTVAKEDSLQKYVQKIYFGKDKTIDKNIWYAYWMLQLCEMQYHKDKNHPILTEGLQKFLKDQTFQEALKTSMFEEKFKKHCEDMSNPKTFPKTENC